MMKKYIAIVLILALALGLLACGGKNGGQTSVTDSTDGTDLSTDAGLEKETLIQLAKDAMGGVTAFSVGYGRKDITPLTSVPLAGAGRSSQRMAKNILDRLYGSVIALADGEGNTIVMMSIDLQRASDSVLEAMRLKLAASVDLTSEQIYITGTHTHSAPDMENNSEPLLQEYATYLYEQLELATLEALADLKPAKMYGGSVEAEGLNFVRHYAYEDENGETHYFGDQFGTPVYNETTRHTTQADPTMYLLKFTREGEKDIVMANWRYHPHFTSSSTKYDVSADSVGAFRMAMESMTDCQFIYFQGAAGNINEKSRITSENKTTDYIVHGRMLAEYAIEGLKTVKELETGTITTSRNSLMGEINHTTDNLVGIATVVQAIWNSGSTQAEAIAADPTGQIRSPYHAGTIITNSKSPATMDIELNAIVIGQSVAIATCPNEMFDTNSMYVEENSPFAMTLNLSYTNGMRNYIPSALAWEHTCYESDTSRFVPGTAEIIQEALVELLMGLKK